METRPFTPPAPPPETSNGHADSHNLNSHLHYYSQRDNDRETTRYLSAATQIDLGYARSVVARVVHEPYRALAPAHGADVTVVARWALDSLRRIARRDAALTATLIAGVFFCWLFGAMVHASAWVIFAIVLLMLAIAFFAIAREYWTRWYRILAGQMLRDGFDPERAPDPPTQGVTLRLQAAADRKSGNLVVFGQHGAFSGSGNRLGQEQIVIDVSRGKAEDDGAPGEPISFTNMDVHTAIAEAIRNIKFPGLNVTERVFVNGKHVRGNRGLQRDPQQPPFASVSKELLASAAEHPTADARAYVCAEIHGWQGQLVVTMFARAVHTGGWLYVEYSFYLLPPIDAAYTVVDYLYNQSLAHRLRKTTTWSVARTLPYLLLAPFSLGKQAFETLLWNVRESAQGYVIQHGQAFDYGALRSIREEACQWGNRWGNRWANRHYFIKRDITMYVLLLQKSLLREMENFLDAHNIATAEFKEQAKIIIDASNKNYSLHIGHVSDSVFAVGDKSQASGGGRRTPPDEGGDRRG
jgi:hypothetical protein